MVDGDTFAADLDLGWGVWRREVTGAPSRVRILGVDTPERGEPEWSEAGAFLMDLLPVGAVCWIESTRLDSFGRCLAWVRLLDGTRLETLYPAEWRVAG